MEQLIIVMLTLHLIADYPLQGDFLAKIKGSNLFLMVVHSFMWAGIISIGLMYFNKLNGGFAEYIVLGFVHLLIDTWKCYRKDKTKALTTDLYIDQFLHLLQIIVSVIF